MVARHLKKNRSHNSPPHDRGSTLFIQIRIFPSSLPKLPLQRKIESKKSRDEGQMMDAK
jgi:hypothetical protein